MTRQHATRGWTRRGRWRSTPLLALLIAWTAAPRAGGEVHLLDPNGSIDAIRERIRPGDEILLPSVIRGPIDLGNLSGEAGRPIVIRGAGADRPGLVRAREYGLRIAGGRHLVVQDIAFAGGLTAAVLIEPGADGAEPADIVLRRIVLTRSEGPAADGVRVRGARGLCLDDVRLQGATAAAIRLADVWNASVRGGVLAGGPGGRRTPVGVAIESGCRDCTLSHLRIAGGIEEGVAIGLDEVSSDRESEDEAPELEAPHADGPHAWAAPVDVLLSHVRLDRCAVAIALGGAQRVAIRRCTAIDPRRAFVRVRAEGPGRGRDEVVLEGNAFLWTPGAIERLALLPDSGAAGVALEANLWWSPEFALVGDRLGPFPGSVRTPQVVDVDPRFDDLGQPMNPAAAGFGALDPALQPEEAGCPPAPQRPAPQEATPAGIAGEAAGSVPGGGGDGPARPSSDADRPLEP